MRVPLEQLKALIRISEENPNLVYADSALAEVQNIMAGDLRDEIVKLWEAVHAYVEPGHPHHLDIAMLVHAEERLNLKAEKCLRFEP